MRPEVTTKPLAQARTMSRRRALMVGIGAGMSALIGTPMLAQSTNQAPAQNGAPSAKMTATQAHDAALAGDIILVDIRTPEEWAETGIGEGAIPLDMRTDDFVRKLIALREANPSTPIAMICRTGNRSQFVVSALAGQGFPGLVDVSEGMVGGRNGRGWIPTELPVYESTPENIAAALEAVMPKPEE